MGLTRFPDFPEALKSFVNLLKSASETPSSAQRHFGPAEFLREKKKNTTGNQKSRNGRVPAGQRHDPLNSHCFFLSPEKVIQITQIQIFDLGCTCDIYVCLELRKLHEMVRNPDCRPFKQWSFWRWGMDNVSSSCLASLISWAHRACLQRRSVEEANIDNFTACLSSRSNQFRSALPQLLLMPAENQSSRVMLWCTSRKVQEVFIVSYHRIILTNIVNGEHIAGL